MAYAREAKVLDSGFRGHGICSGGSVYVIKTPLYEGVARLQIDPSRSASLGLDESEKAGPTDVDSRIKTEVAIIESDTVAMQVIKSLELYNTKEFAGKDAIVG